jgi:transcriptional regulator with XRE-family HTH domain
MTDERFIRANGEAIERFRRSKTWSRRTLATTAKVNVYTIKRAERGNDMRPETITSIANALEVTPAQISHGFIEGPDDVRIYTWKDFMEGAETVRSEIFNNDKFLFDAVLTFPGPSSIFCGLVLALLPLRVLIRIPVYTGIFVDAETAISARKKNFHAITVRPARAREFKLLVPQELIYGKAKRIIVIDDAVITGGTMKRLREVFAKICEVKFACCVCYDGRDLPSDQPPEIIGLKPLEPRKKFPMPWGRDSFCFEDAFVGEAPERLSDEAE